jgi:NAD(P)-dependent dehydrogenase (short-subunit alcohol dehydrogenase family)
MQLNGIERFSLVGQVALVTGASRGIGRALALGLARAGADVTVNFRSHPEEAEQVVAEIEGEIGQRAIAVQADVADPAAVAEMVATTGSELGSVDVLVCNAGINTPGTSLEVPLEDWQRVLSVNLDGPFLCAREVFAKHMASRGSGSIIMIGSICGSVGVYGLDAEEGNGSYAAAKGGVQMLTRSLALEWADRGIRVNCLCPGLIDTAILGEGLGPGDTEYERIVAHSPMGRIGDPDELVGPALLLASAAGSYITGHSITVDGGFTAW